MFKRAATRAVTAASRGRFDCARAASSLGKLETSAEEMARNYLVPTYSTTGMRMREGLVLHAGEGATICDTEDKPYIDFGAGIAVNSLGCSDDGWKAAMHEALELVVHTSNLYHTAAPLLLAKKLVDHSCFDKVFFCNSGTEANEAALKFAKRWAGTQAQPSGFDAPSEALKPACIPSGRVDLEVDCEARQGVCGCWPGSARSGQSKTRFVAFKGGFHGRTMGALSVTHKPAIRQPFAPLVGDVDFAKYNDLESVSRLMGPDVAAVIVEPVQGEGGVIPAEPRFLADLSQLAKEHNALLICDEVQSGLGRAGTLWAHEAAGVEPDIMTLAKPLGGGLPIGATLCKEFVSSAVKPGDHGTTFGGNAFVAASALYVMERLTHPDFLPGVRSLGALLQSELQALAARHPNLIKEVRRPPTDALWAGVELTFPAQTAIDRATPAGLLLISAGTNTLRICPPLTITEAELRQGLQTLAASITGSGLPL